MATAEVAAPQTGTEDDEAWLYGDDNKESQGQASGAGEPQKSHNRSDKKDDREAGELSGEEESQSKENNVEQESEEEEDDDDDDSDDDVQVTIGDIQTFPMNDAARNLFKTQGGYHKTAGAGGSSRPAMSSGTTKGVDVEAVGTINGVPTYDFDLDGIQAEDKPWRKPGADITDYFNYGFNEETWRIYCERQRRMRNESSGSGGRIYTTIRTTGDPKKDLTGESVRTVPVLDNRKPVQARKTSGTIDVIGSTARDSRRPDVTGDPIPTTGKTYPTAPPPIPGLPPGVPPPDYSLPPPGLPPPGYPPPGVPLTSVPPPGVVPPGYEHFYPPPTTRFDDRASSYYDSQTYGAAYNDSHASWDSRAVGYRWDSGRERSPARSESDFSSSGSERDYRYSRDRRYDRDRDRDSPYRRERGDRYRERDRDRDRDRDKERDRDRDRDRERDRYKDRENSRTREGSKDIRIKEEKHRSRRKKDDEDSDHHKSKHKKKKIKKEKDDDDQYPPVLTQEAPVVKTEPTS